MHAVTEILKYYKKKNNSRIIEAEKWISELEDRMMKITPKEKN